MSDMQRIRGTKDLLPYEHRIHDYIVSVGKEIGRIYGYMPMCPPIIEYTKTFDRSLGETSDILSKEIYSFADKNNDYIALRPEFTAGIIRALITNNLYSKLPLKFFSSGPVFRYDRPQAGRQRQFHQLNFEYIGAKNAYSDAETIKLALDILNSLEINESIRLEINSLGCYESRNNYQQKLVEYFSNYKDQLSEESQRRLVKNPLRILDSKNKNDQQLVLKAPVISDYYTDYAKQYFEDLLKYLDLLNVKYNINQRLVRGLDYYCHTVFEFTTMKLGAQGTVIAGGRYDGLVKLMGGRDTPSIGFAVGIERLALMREYNIITPRPIFVFPISEHNLSYSLILVDQLRGYNIATIMDVVGNIAKRIGQAIAQNAKYVIFIGDEEQENNNLKLKDLDKQEEYIMKLDQIIKICTEII